LAPRTVLVTLAVGQVIRHVYRAVRSTHELLTPVHITGTVLDITLNSQVPVDTAGIEDLPASYNFVIDDGTSDHLRPWLVNRDLAGAGGGRPRPGADYMESRLAAIRHLDFEPGDRVELVGQRYSRYARKLRHA
jgi:hypothetical protein